MLSQAIGTLLPLAVGVALSPIPIIAVILMLATPKARSNGPAFVLGWVLGLIVVSVIVLVVASGSDTSSTKSDTNDTLKLVLGVAFLFLALRRWRGRPKHGETPPMPKWMDAIDKFTPARSFVFGIVLSAVNPKNLALTLAAAASIAQAGLSNSDSAIAVAVFVLIGSLTVAGPVLLFMFGGDRATAPLASIKEFMSEHNSVIMMVVLLVLGAKLIGDGWAGLSNQRLDMSHRLQWSEVPAVVREQIAQACGSAVVEAMTELPKVPLESPVLSVADQFGPLLTGWRVLADEPPHATPDPWCREHLTALAGLEARWADAAAGHQLVHGDVRSDNILLTPSGEVVFVDWSSVCVGAPWFDLVCMLPSIELEGGGTPESVLDLAGLADLDANVLLPVVVALAGYFVEQGRLPDPPGLPTLREFQRAQGRVTVDWLRRIWSDAGRVG